MQKANTDIPKLSLGSHITMAQPIAANIYGYHPSLLAAFTFMVLYGIVALYHCHLCVFVPFRRPKKHRYTIPVLIAALCFTAGYGGRIASIRDTTSVLLYAVSSCLIVVAPIFVCATLYLLVANLIRDCLPQWHQVSLGVSPRWIGRIFVTSDILSFITQGSGSAIAASSKWTGSGRTIGINILPIGLMLQVITFSFFLILTWRFVSRVKKSAETSFNPFIKQVLRGVWIAGALIEVSRSLMKSEQANI
jgi:hypothetical protein